MDCVCLSQERSDSAKKFLQETLNDGLTNEVSRGPGRLQAHFPPARGEQAALKCSCGSDGVTRD